MQAFLIEYAQAKNGFGVLASYLTAPYALASMQAGFCLS
tara:strand:- start:35 stop:151 length:117 start_codon:yes stop_codon:yes gene_type:complete